MRSNINLVEELTLGNFKCFSTPQKLPFRPITLLYGANRTGKSPVIQALKWLPELLELESLLQIRVFRNGPSDLDHLKRKKAGGLSRGAAETSTELITHLKET
jgi:predicted ATPase